MTSGPDSPDSFQGALDEIVEYAVALLEGRLLQVTDDRSARTARVHEIELIETSAHITVILLAPGYRAGDLRVSLAGVELVVTAPDFTVCTTLHTSVDASSLEQNYVNGVLSARLQKSFA